MYLRQRTWLENGPAAVRIPVPPIRCGRGLGADVGSQVWCDQASAFNPVAWFACFGRDVANVATATTSADLQAPPAIPPPAAPTLTTDPAAASLPGVSYAGTDSDGNPVYAVPETADQNMARYRALVADFMTQQGQRTPPSVTPAGWLLPLGIGAAVLGGLVLFGGHRRGR